MGLKKINAKEQMDLAYYELYNRNYPIINVETQEQLKRIRVGVAGCGSTGGAFIDGALRTGVQSFHLADNGEYELSNLNRQMVSLSELGSNKADAYASKIKNVNADAFTKVWMDGLTEENMDDFLENIDFLFDAVDVTTSEGMRMKLMLHEKAAEKKIPTGSALDLGFTQWIKSYNYHLGELALQGRLRAAQDTHNPIKAILSGFISVEELPLEITEEIIRLLQTPGASACQLASACFLLSSMVTPYLIYFIKNKSLHPLVAIDVASFFENSTDQAKRKKLTQEKHQKLLELLKKID